MSKPSTSIIAIIVIAVILICVYILNTREIAPSVIEVAPVEAIAPVDNSVETVVTPVSVTPTPALPAE